MRKIKSIKYIGQVLVCLGLAIVLSIGASQSPPLWHDALLFLSGMFLGVSMGFFVFMMTELTEHNEARDAKRQTTK